MFQESAAIIVLHIAVVKQRLLQVIDPVFERRANLDSRVEMLTLLPADTFFRWAQLALINSYRYIYCYDRREFALEFNQPR